MKKKLFIMVTTVLVMVLSACGATKTTEKESSKNSPKDFIELTERYFDKQQALMMKQAEGVSGEFTELSQHAQEVIASDEYLEWEKEVKKVESFKLEKSAEAEKYIELQTALNDYGKIQTEYFEALAKAKDKEAYNEVNTRLAEQLGATQDSFVKIMEEIEE